MSKPFKKLDFSLPFGMDTAVPVDYNSYFTSFNEATAAAALAQNAGSSDSIYYIGQVLTVVDDATHTTATYQIGNDRKLHVIPQSEGDGSGGEFVLSGNSVRVESRDDVADGVEVKSGVLSNDHVGVSYAKIAADTTTVESSASASIRKDGIAYSIDGADFSYGFPSKDGTFAMLSDIGLRAFSEVETYDVGEYVIWGDAVWKCTVPVSSAGGWTGTNNWERQYGFEQTRVNAENISSIDEKIPDEASDVNQLADKDFVNSSISTNTAYFLGTLDYVTDLHFTAPTAVSDVDNDAICTALDSHDFTPLTASNNDYCFVKVDFVDTAMEDEYRRFKFNGDEYSWMYEYTLNNSSFTANQWASINSGITSGLVEKLDGIDDDAQVNVIETVQVNGTDLPITNKTVNVDIPVTGVQVDGVTVVENRVAKIGTVGPSSVSASGSIADAYLTKAFVDGKFFYSNFYREDQGSGTHGSSSGIEYITFKPSIFNITDGGYIYNLSILTRYTSGGMPSTTVYIYIVDASTGAVLDISDGHSMDTTNTFVSFVFGKKAPLTANKSYRLEFRDASGALRTDVGLEVFTNGTVDGYYVTTTAGDWLNWRPMMEVYSMIPTEDLGPFITKNSGTFTTEAGAITNYIAATVEGKIVGGTVVSNSRHNDSNNTTYTLNRIDNTVNGVTTTYKFTTDNTDSTGIARFGDITITDVKVNGASLPITNKAVDVTVPSKATVPPVIAGDATIGDSAKYAAENHVHPGETRVAAYALPDECFPVTYTSGGTNYTIASNDGLEFGDGLLIDVLDRKRQTLLGNFNSNEADTTSIRLKWANIATGITNLKFNGVAPVANTSPTLHDDAVYVRDVQVAKEMDFRNGIESRLSPYPFETVDVSATASKIRLLKEDAFPVTFVSGGINHSIRSNDGLSIIMLTDDTAVLYSRDGSTAICSFVRSGSDLVFSMDGDVNDLKFNGSAGSSGTSPSLTESFIEYHTVPLSPYANNVLEPVSGNSYYPTVDMVPESYGSGKMRDLWFTIDCTEFGEDTLSLFWDESTFVPCGGDAANMELVTGRQNVFMLCEYVPGRFMVAREVFTHNSVVNSVNGQTGTVILTSGDVGALSLQGGEVSGHIELKGGSYYVYPNAMVDNVYGAFTGDGFRLRAGDSYYTMTLPVASGELATKAEVDSVKSDVDELENALDTKAPLISPSLSGTPTSMTPLTSSISDRIATTEYVSNVIDGRLFVSRYYNEPRTGASASGLASGFYYIIFKPKVFGISDGGYLTKLNIHTRKTATSSQLPSVPIKLVMTDSTGNTILDESDVQTGMSTADNDVRFTFSGKIPLSSDTVYRIQFRSNTGEYPVANVGIQVFTQYPNEEYYIYASGNPSSRWRPFMEVFAMNPPFISKMSGYSLTEGGAITKYLSATVDSKIVGGPLVTGSAYNNNTTTAYYLGRIEDTKTSGNTSTTTTYSFTTDKTDSTGVARFGDISIGSISVNSTSISPDSNKNVDITAVTGVKGDAESTYRTGQVNITPANIGALGNSGAQTLNGMLTVASLKVPNGSGGYVSIDTEAEDCYLNITLNGQTVYQIGIPFRGGVFALLSDMYAAVQQIAPEFDATRTEQTKYKQYELVSKNGVVYQCTSINGHHGAWNASNWEAKKVSELFLPLTGGTMSGTLEIGDSASNTTIDPTNGINTSHVSTPTASIAGFTIDTEDAGASLGFKDGDITVKMPISASGTLALLADTMRFSTTVSYDVGDVVFHRGSFWLCTTAHTAGAWNFSDFAGVLGLSTVANNVAYPTASTPTSGDNSTKVATTAFVQGALPYAIVTKSISSNAVVADDRTVNFVDATSQTGTLSLLMPLVQTSGKSRDFYFAIKCGATPPTVTASYSPINAKGESADLTLTANATTVLRFTEIANGSTGVDPVFVVTGGANGGGSIDPATLNTKVNSTALAPNWSNASVSYQASQYITYNGNAYECMAAYTTDAQSPTPDHDIYDSAAASGHWIVTDVETILTGKVDVTDFNEHTNQIAALDNNKLDATAGAPAFSPLSTYVLNEYVTNGGQLYRCTTAVTATGAWDPSKWELTDMTSPDATLDITATGLLRVVAADGTTLWHQGYNLGTSNSLTLSSDAVNCYTFSANVTGETAFTLPNTATGKVGDFVLDVTNPPLSSTAAGFPPAFSTSSTYASGAVVYYDSELWECITAVSTEGAWTGTTNWQKAYPSMAISQFESGDVNIVIPKGESISDMLSFAPSSNCELYFTLTAFALSGKPTWKVVRQDVEVVAS